MIQRSTALSFSFALLVLLSLSTGCDRSAKPTPEIASANAQIDGDAVGGTVTLEIKSEQKTQTIIVNNVADGATLESAMRSANDLDAQISGSGFSAFVNEINGQPTSGNEGWTFSVDGEWSNQGIGKTILHPPTTVVWEFGEMKN